MPHQPGSSEPTPGARAHAERSSQPEIVRKRLEAYLSKEEMTGGKVVAVSTDFGQEGVDPVYELQFQYMRAGINRPGATFLGNVKGNEADAAVQVWETRIQEWITDWK